MKILFIYSLYEMASVHKPLRSQEQIQFGISYISALLKRHGHNTKLIVLSKISNWKNNEAIIKEYLTSFKPKLICFTSIYSEYDFISSISKFIKSIYKDAFHLIGGIHASLNPHEVLKGDFDAICIGEGEYPTLELVGLLEKNIEPCGIKNLWIKNGDEIQKNEVRPFLENLDELPFLDKDIWQNWIEEGMDSQHSVLLGRGCPFECAYCCNHALKKIANGQYVRLRSIGKIIEELKLIDKKYPDNRNVYFEIETLYLNQEWSLELCKKLKDLNATLNKPFKFGVNLRITSNGNYDDLFRACKESNFRFINFGLESGSEKIRKDILRRSYSNIDVINAVMSARKNRIQFAFFNLIGLPGETKEDFKETINMNRTCQPNWTMTSIFFPYPGTDLYNLCKTKGYLNNHIDAHLERTRPVLNLPNFSKSAIRKSYEWFYYDVYKGHEPIFPLLIRVFVTKLRSWPKLFNIYLYFIHSKAYQRTKLFIKSDLKKTQAKL